MQSKHGDDGHAREAPAYAHEAPAYETPAVGKNAAATDPEYAGEIVQEAKLHQTLKGRHMQMIAM